MALAMCAGCSKMLSISRLPGGNPMAKAYPDMFALAYGTCDRCDKRYCDQCIGSAGGKCPGCGKRLAIEGPPPGETAELPENYKRLLKDLDSGKLTSRKARRSKSSWAKAVPWAIGLVALLAIVSISTTPGSAVQRSARLAMHISAIGALFLLVAPGLGAVLTTIVAAVLAKVMGRSAFVSLRVVWLLMYLGVLVMSPFLAFYARQAWGWSGWSTAYLVAGVVGSALGGLLWMVKIVEDLRKGAR